MSLVSKDLGAIYDIFAVEVYICIITILHNTCTQHLHCPVVYLDFCELCGLCYYVNTKLFYKRIYALSLTANESQFLINKDIVHIKIIIMCQPEDLSSVLFVCRSTSSLVCVCLAEV